VYPNMDATSASGWYTPQSRIYSSSRRRLHCSLAVRAMLRQRLRDAPLVGSLCRRLGHAHSVYVLVEQNANSLGDIGDKVTS
jgi:hypothetical protein